MSIENGHPFACAKCGSEYTTARYASRHCRVGSVDLTSGIQTPFTEEAEAAAQAAEDAEWAAMDAECKYECSCGERFREVAHAKACRKCRVYTEEGWCTSVYDLAAGAVVWSRETPTPEPAPEESPTPSFAQDMGEAMSVWERLEQTVKENNPDADSEEVYRLTAAAMNAALLGSRQ